MMCRLMSLIAALAALVAAAIVLATPAHADYRGSRFFDGTKPVCVSTDWIDNSRVRSAVRAAVTNWNNQTKLDVRARSNCSDGNYKQRIWVLDAYYSASWLGRAEVTRSWWGKSPTPYRWTADGWTYLHDRVKVKLNLRTIRNYSDSRLQSIAAHEIGHALGLDHLPNGTYSVMPEQGWVKYVKERDIDGSWDHPGVDRLYWRG